MTTPVASKISSFWTNWVEYPLFAAGLYTNPLKRFVVVGGLTALAIYALKPKGLFDEDGNRRPWKLSSPSDKNAVPLPAEAIPLIVGATSLLVV